MLIQFNFKNFKSFKNETTLDMTATSITEHPYNLIDTVTDEKYIKTAAIYGANASGKSSVLEAFAFMRTWIISSFKNASDKETIPFKRFLFDSNSKNEPAEFEAFFQHKNKEYQYGFSLDNKKILEEWLYIKNKNGAQLIYATHDNYTLTRDIFRRDQIWFVEKNINAVSNLYSLAEYKSEDDKKIRKDASYNKDYLLGKYGAIPILRGYDMWRTEDAKIK